MKSALGNSAVLGGACPICGAVVCKQDGKSLVCSNPSNPHWLINKDGEPVHGLMRISKHQVEKG